MFLCSPPASVINCIEINSNPIAYENSCPPVFNTTEKAVRFYDNPNQGESVVSSLICWLLAQLLPVTHVFCPSFS